MGRNGGNECASDGGRGPVPENVPGKVVHGECNALTEGKPGAAFRALFPGKSQGQGPFPRERAAGLPLCVAG